MFLKAGYLFLFMLLNYYAGLFTSNLFFGSNKIKLPFWNFAVLTLLTIFIILIINGYRVSCIRSLLAGKENVIFPYINLKKNLKIGLKYTLAALVCYIPLFYLIMGAGFFGAFSMTVEHKFLEILGICFLVISRLLVLLVFIYQSVCLLGVNRIFAETDNIFSFIKFKELFSLIRANKKFYFVSAGLLFLVYCLNSLILFGLKPLFYNLEIEYLTIVPLALVSVYEFYIGAFAVSKFKEYQADQHQ